MASIKSPLADGTKFYVTSWITGKVLATCETLNKAKRLARKEGHAPWNKWNGYASMAFVAADAKNWDHTTNDWHKTSTDRVLVYNPRFS
jgi:hypothetical protein